MGQWGQCNVVLNQSLRLGSGPATSFTILPVRNETFLMSIVEIWDPKEIERLFVASQTSLYMDITESIKCRLCSSKSRVGPERWGLGCWSKVHSLSSCNNYIAKPKCSSGGKCLGPTPKPFNLILLGWGPKISCCCFFFPKLPRWFYCATRVEKHKATVFLCSASH